jgi:stearoyl-CoA desaturase (delta-9 desaturase)
LAGWDGVLGGLLWGGLVRIAALDHMTWAVNSIGHTLGSQPFRSGDQSRNVAWLALPTMGGAWHNNHHAFPSSATLDFKFYQIDGSGIFVRVLSTLGLASKLNRPTPQKRQQRR